MAYKFRASWMLLAASLVLIGVLLARVYAVPQPNMEAALGHLEMAKASLEKAEHNKGGFRVKAIEHVNQAITTVREGITAGNR